MAAGPTISPQKILAASQGDQAAMLEVLQQMASAHTQAQAVTNTTPAAGIQAGQPSPTAARPSQATGTVSILDGNLIIQIVNPGSQSAISQLQARQATANATDLTAIQPVRPIFHQLRVSTSPAFNVNSNTQTFGGDSGSTQCYWSLTGLGSGTRYVQFRSSFDCVNWNQWKNANSGNAFGGLASEVTTENAGNSEWGLFLMPGKNIVGIGAAAGLSDQETVGLASEVFSSGMVAIAGPSGFIAQNNGVSGFTLSDVDLETGSSPGTGITDYPVEVRIQMAQASTNNTLGAYANFFAIAFDPSNENVTIYTAPDKSASWFVMRLPGGARVAFGQGKNLDGTNIWTPGLSWMSSTRMMSICSLTDTPLDQHPVTGIYQAQLSGYTAKGTYMQDTGAPTSSGVQKVNWLAILWEAGAPVSTVGGFPFLEIQLQGGHAMYIGAGQVASSGTVITLPAGCTQANSLSICTPGGSANNGFHMRGVQQCGMVGLAPTLIYTDNSNNWGGAVNFMLGCWK